MYHTYFYTTYLLCTTHNGYNIQELHYTMNDYIMYLHDANISKYLSNPQLEIYVLSNDPSCSYISAIGKYYYHGEKHYILLSSNQYDIKVFGKYLIRNKTFSWDS